MQAAIDIQLIVTCNNVGVAMHEAVCIDSSMVCAYTPYNWTMQYSLLACRDGVPLSIVYECTRLSDMVLHVT